MASGLTHILLTKSLQDKFEDGELKDILASAVFSFQVGAVAPDLPYASIADNDFFFSNESPLADDFHYRMTNQIPLQALRKLKSLKGNIEEQLHDQMFTFFLGYISHVFADGIIHPFVRDIVGDYKPNQAEHRSLEMQLDVLLFEELTKSSGFALELNYTNIYDEIKNFLEVDGFDQILQIFSELINTTYHKHYSVEKITNWIIGLHRMFSIAEGDHFFFYRNIKINSFTYRNRSEINRERVLILKRPIDREINFLKVDEIDFFKHCVPQYYFQFTEVAKKAFSYVFEEGQELDENDIPMINLDTGRLVENDHLDLIPEFWKKTISI